jgi:hypothetical protein
MGKKKRKSEGISPWTVINAFLVIILLFLLVVFGNLLIRRDNDDNECYCVGHSYGFKIQSFGENSDDIDGWGLLIHSVSSNPDIRWSDIGLRVNGADGKSILRFNKVDVDHFDMRLLDGDKLVYLKTDGEPTFLDEGERVVLDEGSSHSLDFDETRSLEHVQILIWDHDLDNETSPNDFIIIFADPDGDGEMDIPSDAEVVVSVNCCRSKSVARLADAATCPEYVISGSVNRFAPNSSLTKNNGGWTVTHDIDYGNFWARGASYQWDSISIVIERTSGDDWLRIDDVGSANATFSGYEYEGMFFIHGNPPIHFDDAGVRKELTESTLGAIHTIEFISLENVTLVSFDKDGDMVLSGGDYVIVFNDNDGDGVNNIPPGSTLNAYYGETLLVKVKLA